MEGDSRSPEKKKQKTRKLAGAAIYKSNYDSAWESKYPVKPGKTQGHFYCTVCCKDVSCSHQAETDVSRHVAGKGHTGKMASLQKQPTINFRPANDPLTYKVSRAEVLMTNFIVENNLPIAVSDKCGPLFKSMFPDSDIAKNYQCAKTKTFCILNGALAPSFHAALVNVMQNNPYSLATDGSNDSDLTKMNPVTVKIYDINRSMVTSNFLDMCTTTGATAAAIFEKIDLVLRHNNIPWLNCVGFSVDNASVNMGKKNSIKSRVLEENENVYFMGCPCHMAHNAANKGSRAFVGMTNFDVEELVIDSFYWFDKSTKRKNELNEFCEFCDFEYKQVLKHVSTRWLSLETAITRILKMYEPLKSYFLSGNENQARFKRLSSCFEDKMTEIYLLFYQFALERFDTFNLFLQREEPCAYLLDDQIQSFLRYLLVKFVKPIEIKNAVSLIDIDLTNPDVFLSLDEVQIGFVTRQKLRKLLSDGDISDAQATVFLQAALQFYIDSVMYVVKTFPFNDMYLMHAKFVNFDNRLTATFDSVEFFVKKFPKVLDFSENDMDLLLEQFREYQLMEDLNDEVISKVTVVEKFPDGSKREFVRMDMVWGLCIRQKLPLLFKVALVVFLLPHSNAEEERVFSMVRKNKTDFRASLQSDGTLSSILTVKLNNKEAAHKFEPSKDLVEKSKKVTWEYNKQHP
jgi:hAT family C-terminal dimerisation region